MHILPGLAGHLVCSLLAVVSAFVRPGVRPASGIQLHPGRLTRCVSSRSTRRPETMTSWFGRGFGRASALFFLAVMFLAQADPAMAATSPGTRISNIATVNYEIGGTPNGPEVSNPADLVTRSPAIIEFLTSAPTLGTAEDINIPPTLYSTSGTSAGPFAAILPSLPGGLTNPVALTQASAYHTGQPLFIRLTDLDQNLNALTNQTILVRLTCIDTGDTEWLVLTETGADTGQFAGYLPTTGAGATSGDGVLSVIEGCQVDVFYTDPVDGSDTADSSALVDPTGIVFDSSNGQPVNGATITLINDNTGLPATVLGDDGVSSFPATVISGGSATDSGGAVYNFPPGGFRFPLIAPGDYYLDVSAPVGYTTPSVVTDAILQTLPGAPFDLTTGSRGEVFTVNPGPVVRIDIPADPQGDGLWLQKQVNHDDASIGDFLQYRLILENLSVSATATDVVITDLMPNGFRYQRGSTRIDGLSQPDPAISSDGQQLQFNAGNINAGQRVEVSYVVEVTAGTKTGEAINTAQAEDATGQQSNLARASVDIQPLFFKDDLFLAGRVLSGSCDQDDTEMTGVGGVRIYLEDGSYIVTDANGRYHFEGIDPGVHVVQVDLASLPTGYEMLPCEQTSQTAGRTFSQFVDLQGGSFWRVNFYTAPKPTPSGDVSLQMSAELDGKTATFHLDLATRAVSTENLRLTIMLPGDSSYLPGTAKVDNNSVEEPQVISGAVTFRFNQMSADQMKRVSFQAQLDDSQGSGELPAKAMLMFDTFAATSQRTPIVETRFHLVPGVSGDGEEIKLYPRFPSFVASLQETDRVMLEQLVKRLKKAKILQLDLVGHTDNQPIARRSRHIFADNQALSEARAKSVADFMEEHLDLSNAIVTVRGMGEQMPLADNTTSSGRALNRRVELNLVTAGETQPAKLSLNQAVSERQTVTIAGPDPSGGESKQPLISAQSQPQPPEIDATWHEKADLKSAMVWPPKGYVPQTPSTTVMVQYIRGGRVELELNGKTVNPLNFDGVKSQKGSDRLVAVWKGVDLHPGENRLKAKVLNAEGEVGATVEREIWYVENAHRAAIVPEYSHLIADGLHSPVLAVRLTDQQGHPLRPGVYSEVQIEPPYQLTQQKTLDDQGSLSNDSRQRIVTGPDGIALVTLEPTTQSGSVILHIPLRDQKSEELHTWLKPAPRDWILVGFAEGTVGYNNLSGNQVSLEEAGIDEHYYDDGQVKFFAKGAVKGEWLLTMAYDSDKPDLDGDSLHQAIDPDTYYPLYGDETKQGYEAASASDLYIKLEKDQAYALFGDMETGLNKTELGQYNRNLNGIKVANETDRYSFTAFAAQTKQTFAKDEIQGDGTSGRYQLSNTNIVINSDQVVIETRGRLHSESIINLQTLSRYTDYEIDYNTGTLYFKKPIPSKDEDFNPIFIVARYEVEGSTGENDVYGARAAVKLLDQKVEIGATYVHEEQDQSDSNLYAVDSWIELNDKVKLHIEAARTKTETVSDEIEGNAYIAEIDYSSNKTTAKAYYREQEDGFGLGQQNESEDGTRKYGVQAESAVTPEVNVDGELYHEEKLSTDAERNVAEIGASYSAPKYKVRAGVRQVDDKLDDGTKQQSTQALVGVDVNTSIEGITLTADFEQSLDNNNQSQAYPTLLRAGADYRISERVRLFADQEFTWGNENNTQATRAGVALTPWKGGTVESSVEQNINENGERMFALFGLGQNWTLNKNWSIDASFDRSQTIKEVSSDSVNGEATPAHGTEEDFTSLSVGATYRSENWSWSNRLETRQADSEKKYGVSSRVVKQVNSDVAVSAKASIFINDRKDAGDTEDGSITLGMAYRPDDSRWIILERFDFEFENSEDISSRRLINHIHANWYMSRKVQFSLYSGVKYVYDTIGGQSYDGVTDMHAAEARYNVNSRWDIGAHASWLHSWNGNSFDYAAGVSVGYLIRTNTWVSLGYNFKGFEDPDFSSAQYTAEGPYMRFRMKFDQESVREAAEWLNK